MYSQIHPLLRQEAVTIANETATTQGTQVANKTLEQVFLEIEEFLQGFRYNTIIPSALNCSRYVESSIDDLNKTLQQW